MLILAFDTSGIAGSVALLDGERLIAHAALDPARRSAQTLAPAIVELLRANQVETRQIRLVATTTGPGSFTGLRVGVTTAKTFAYAVGAEVIAVSTLEAAAHGIPVSLLVDQPVEVHAIVDAQRKELFWGRFFYEPQAGQDSPKLPRLRRIAADTVIGSETWLAGLQPGTIVTGTGLKRVETSLPTTVLAAPADCREVSATIVGQLAWRYYLAGRRDDLWKLAPVYLRPSYAEEKAAKRQATDSGAVQPGGD